MTFKRVFIAFSFVMVGGIASGNQVGITNTPTKKKTPERVHSQTETTNKQTIKKSTNPDRLDFIGVPSVNKDRKSNYND